VKLQEDQRVNSIKVGSLKCRGYKIIHTLELFPTFNVSSSTYSAFIINSFY